MRINKMLKIDLHLHTIMSGDSHNTIFEYINRAKELKMKVIGISDHGPDLENSKVHRYYLGNLERIPKKIYGIRILNGVDANIINIKGDIDLLDKTIKKLDYVIANVHKGAGFDINNSKNNTKALVNAIRSKKMNIISHPFHTYEVPTDIKIIFEEACKNNILLEVDLAYLKKRFIQKNTIPNLKCMIDIVKKYKKKVIVNSDSHNIWELGDDSVLTKELKKKIGLTDDLIINNYPKELEKFLGVKF
jgi:putative hydrolase